MYHRILIKITLVSNPSNHIGNPGDRYGRTSSFSSYAATSTLSCTKRLKRYQFKKRYTIENPGMFAKSQITLLQYTKPLFVSLEWHWWYQSIQETLYNANPRDGLITNHFISVYGILLVTHLFVSLLSGKENRCTSLRILSIRISNSLQQLSHRTHLPKKCSLKKKMRTEIDFTLRNEIKARGIRLLFDPFVFCIV